MRKLMLFVLVLGLACGLVGLGSLAVAGSATHRGFPIVSVTVNGQPLASDAPAILIGDRVFVPLRAVQERLGGKVAWDARTKTAAVVTSGTLGYLGGTDGTVSILGEGATPLEIYGIAVANAEAAYAVARLQAHATFMSADYSTGNEFALYQQACQVAEDACDTAKADALEAYQTAIGEEGGAMASEPEPQEEPKNDLDSAKDRYQTAMTAAETKRDSALIALGNLYGRPYPLDPIYDDHRDAVNEVLRTYDKEVTNAQNDYRAAGGTP